MSTTTITAPPPTNRTKIRFAPLPDPRRSVLLGDDGVEHPIEADDRIPASVSLAIVGAQPPSVPSPQIFNSIPLPPSPLIQPQPEASTSTSPCILSTSSSSGSTSSSGKHWSKSLLTPFLSHKKHHKKSSSPSPDSASGSSYASSSSSTPNSIHSLTPTQSPLCDISLSRPATNDGSGWGAALSRWTSGGSMASTSNPGKGYGFGAPLTRTQSTQSWKKSKGRRPSSSSSMDARASGLLSSLHSDKPKPGKGTRLLNGRVYGAKRGAHANANANPFATISSTYPDPEFVEWGYGGTGSVKHQKDGVGGRVWGRLAKEGSVFDDDAENTGRGRQPTSPSRAAAEDDDGSGMGWVKRRREQREREAREKAEKEAKEKEEAEKEKEQEQQEEDLTASVSTMDTSTTLATTETGETTPPESPVEVVEEDKPAPAPVPSLPTPTLTAPPTPTRQTSAEDHVTTSFLPASSEPVQQVEETQEEEEDEDDEEDESGSNEDEDEGDEGDSEESDEEVRKTSLGAGVEVVSRHRA
ncbi:hypothetical protein VNI00_006040 [Paramarasmius palmivorus]|uniref:Uncharacterized protein n=1 Tax=Paramarasmius palmivorus TaxID=297713 RepID=A0AAW0DEF7_9AGAR